MTTNRGNGRAWGLLLALGLLAAAGCGDSRRATDPLAPFRGVWALAVGDRNATMFNGPAESFSTSPDVTAVIFDGGVLVDYDDRVAITSRGSRGEVRCAFKDGNVEILQGTRCLMRLKPGDKNELELLAAEPPPRTADRDWSLALRPGGRFRRLRRDLPEQKEVIENGYIYGNGGVRYTGDPAKEKPVRQVTIYYEDSGTPFYRGGWKMGKIHGSGRIYYRSGILKEVGTWTKGERDGAFKEYSADGHLLREGAYAGGGAQGEAVYYFRSGKVRERVTFKDGRPEGRYVSHWINGRRRFVGLYHKPYLSDIPSIEGSGILFYENGNRQYDGEFQKGLFHGMGRYFNEKGECVYEGKWKEGAKI